MNCVYFRQNMTIDIVSQCCCPQKQDAQAIVSTHMDTIAGYALLAVIIVETLLFKRNIYFLLLYFNLRSIMIDFE